MAYLKPGSFTKVANRVAMMTTARDVHTLQVAKRQHAGDVQELPVIPLEHNGALYLVSTRGESDWVRNVRAAGRVRMGQKGSLAEYLAIEVPTTERDPIVTAYRAKVGREVESYWKRLPDAADHPVFRLTSP